MVMFFRMIMEIIARSLIREIWETRITKMDTRMMVSRIRAILAQENIASALAAAAI
jgi:hypothetical protein